MKKIMTIAMVALSVAVFAQTGKQISKSENTEISNSKKSDKKQEGKKGKRYKGDFSKKFENLNLTDSQKAKIQALKFENKDVFKNGENVPKEDREKRFAEMDKQMKSILTKEQYAKFQEIQKEKLAVMTSKGNRKSRKEGKFTDLNLTETQKKQLKALKSERKSKGELTQNTKLSKEEIQSKRAERDTKIKTILTPEQYAKFSAKKDMKQRKKSRS